MKLADVIQTAVDLGPLVVEPMRCCKCEQIGVVIHAFCESIACPACGHQNASGVPVYNTEPFGDE